jgi:hypothetical protein
MVSFSCLYHHPNELYVHLYDTLRSPYSQNHDVTQKCPSMKQFLYSDPDKLPKSPLKHAQVF